MHYYGAGQGLGAVSATVLSSTIGTVVLAREHMYRQRGAQRHSCTACLPYAVLQVACRQLRDELMSRMEWLEHEEGTPYHVLEVSSSGRASGRSGLASVLYIHTIHTYPIPPLTSSLDNSHTTQY